MDQAAKKTALRKIPYGLFVAGVRQESEVGGFTATWLSQCSFEPPLVMLAVRADSAPMRMIESDQVFSINFLGKDQQDLAQFFTKPVHQRTGGSMGEYAYRLGETGCPILEAAIAFVECRVTGIVAKGDHHVVVGEVVEAGVQRDEPALVLADTGWQYGG